MIVKDSIQWGANGELSLEAGRGSPCFGIIMRFSND